MYCRPALRSIWVRHCVSERRAALDRVRVTTSSPLFACLPSLPVRRDRQSRLLDNRPQLVIRELTTPFRRRVSLMFLILPFSGRRKAHLKKVLFVFHQHELTVGGTNWYWLPLTPTERVVPRSLLATMAGTLRLVNLSLFPFLHILPDSEQGTVGGAKH